MAIKERWNAACAATIGSPLFWRIAVDHRAIECQLRPLIERYARGVVLDAGAGRLAWRALLEPQATAYLPIDRWPTHNDLACCADLQGFLPLRNQSVDTVFCCSVLEHTPEPWRILPEFKRVLRADGHVILSVPFLYHLHGAPEDFFRFTPHGVARLARTAGFEIVELSTGGGLAHSVCHAVSMCVTALLWTPRYSRFATAPVQALSWIARLVDRADRQRLFAQTVNAVLRRDSIA